MELEGTIGRRVKISLDDGSDIDGFVHSFSAHSGKISLDKVQCIENGRKKKLVGLQHYFAEEIQTIIVTEDVCKNKKKAKAQESSGYGKGGMLRGKCESSHLNRLQFVDPSSLILKNKKLLDDTLTSSGNETGSSDSDYINALPQSDEYTIIPKLCSTFYEAITYIKKHQVIGVAMEGVSIGRFGKLCWLQVAVPDHVFMFDVLQMGRAFFDEGMKDILENEHILKVLHDCRMVSDILHHQYDINMINVFDTQVANVFVYRLRHHRDWPRYVEGLASALVQHLDVSLDEVNWAVVRERRREEDEEVWRERPPQQHLVNAAVKNVKHLLDLRVVLMEKMMEEYVAGVNIYLMQVRDASDRDAKRYQTTPHLLPVAFQDISAFMKSSRNRNINFSVREIPKDMNGFRENCTGINQPHIYYSKDSIWHAGSRKTDTSTPAAATGKVSSTNQMSVDKNSAQKSQENVSVQSPKHVQQPSPCVADSDSGSKVSVPTQRLEDASLDSDNYSVQSSQSVVPSRRNLHRSPDNDLVAKAVAGMNARKLEMDEGLSKSENHKSGYNASNVDTFEEASELSAEVSAGGELRGGSLMRALVHEQDISGYEAAADIESFTIMPAGKMIKVDKKANSKSGSALNSVAKDENAFSHSTNLSYNNRQGVNGNISPIRRPVAHSPCEILRPAIPGGDIATTSPPRRSGLSEQELLLLERLQNTRASVMYEENISAKKQFQSLSDTDLPVQEPSSQGASRSNRLMEQLQGKLSPQYHLGNQGISRLNPSTKESYSPVHYMHDQESGCESSGTESQGSPISPTSSQTNAKLHNLLQKLKQQQSV
ncbi:uncharacterized protein LOC132725780 isoform X2 [Ruditapes philippinarum]|uniref:uncharacterized protein LOC132725780 isoform X2 n=1 Tax=Ruditapes philippinarum TaxID=129788 RepID=UPI00295AB862|nr:uncharacterized protein LOC132725780 isoform X2 [Ruditapes philippinarum]